MAEETVNGVRVVFRERFPAEFGWDLLSIMRRIEGVRKQRVSEIVGRELTTAELVGSDVPEDVMAAMEEVDWFGTVIESITADEADMFIRGATAEWDFPCDLSEPGGSKSLDTVSEFIPLASKSVALFYAANSREKLSGESESGSTSPSED